MNPTLLCREPTGAERVLQNSLRKVLPTVPHMVFTEGLWRNLGLDGPDPFFSAVLSLISMPPSASFEFTLCRYLLQIRDFYLFLARPENFEHKALVQLCRLMMRIDMRFDIRLVSALAGDSDLDRDSFLRILSVLDETSPGGRLTLTLTRVLRDSDPLVAAKVERLLNRRVASPMLVQRQLGSENARTRANAIESLWGVDSLHTRRCLDLAAKDSNNRVVGNALVGLYMLKDATAAPRIRRMASHPAPEFRTTALWVMGKTGDPAFKPQIANARSDADERVRRMAEQLLAKDPSAAPSDRHAPTLRQNAPQEVAANARDEGAPLRLDGTFGRLYRRG